MFARENEGPSIKRRARRHCQYVRRANLSTTHQHRGGRVAVKNVEETKVVADVLIPKGVGNSATTPEIQKANVSSNERPSNNGVTNGINPFWMG